MLILPSESVSRLRLEPSTTVADFVLLFPRPPQKSNTLSVHENCLFIQKERITRYRSKAECPGWYFGGS